MPNAATNVESVTIRQHDIKNNQVESQSGGLVKTLIAIGGEIHPVAFATQAIADGHPQCFFIFHQQNILIHFCTPNSIPEDTLPFRHPTAKGPVSAA